MSGTVLVELMVGLTIGGLVATTALSALQVLGQTQRIVDEQSQLLQQAGFIFRMLGQQIRAAGSSDLESWMSPDPAMGRLAFRFSARVATDAEPDDAIVVQGANGVRHDTVTLVDASTGGTGTVRHDCLGQDVALNKALYATFHADASGVLRCKSSSGQNQPIAFGVAAFRVRYRVRQGLRLRDLDASAVDAAAQWPEVSAMEVCLDLHGEPVASGSSAHYVDCAGHDATDKSRRHLVVHHLFQLRAVSQST